MIKVKDIMDLARKGGNAALKASTKIVRSGISPRDITTAGDKAVSEVLRKELNEKFPGIPVVSEEFNPDYLHLTDKSRGVTLKEIGIDIDRDKLEKLTQNCRPKKWQILCKNTSNEKIDPNEVISVNSWVLGQFIGNMENDIQYLAKTTVISFEDYTFRAVTPGSKIEIDKSAFTNKENISDWLTSTDNQLKLKILSNVLLQYAYM